MGAGPEQASARDDDRPRPGRPRPRRPGRPPGAGPLGPLVLRLRGQRELREAEARARGALCRGRHHGARTPKPSSQRRRSGSPALPSSARPRRPLRHGPRTPRPVPRPHASAPPTSGPGGAPGAAPPPSRATAPGDGGPGAGLRLARTQKAGNTGRRRPVTTATCALAPPRALPWDRPCDAQSRTLEMGRSLGRPATWPRRPGPAAFVFETGSPSAGAALISHCAAPTAFSGESATTELDTKPGGTRLAQSVEQPLP